MMRDGAKIIRFIIWSENEVRVSWELDGLDFGSRHFLTRYVIPDCDMRRGSEAIVRRV